MRAAEEKKARAIADVWAAIVERKRRTGEPSNILKRRKKRRRQNTAEKRTEQKRPQQEDSNRTEKGKSFQYVCPHCDQSVTSTTRTGQVDLRGTCGHRFRVREGRLCAKAYDYVCPACNGHVASNVATGHIDHRRVCLWEQFFCEGWCCEREMVWFTGAHFATEMWEAMWGQGESTINPRAATCFMSRTVQSARKHGVMHTVARCAQLLFGHRSHVGALRSRMTRRRENDARRNIGTFPTKRRCACCRGTASVDAQQETAVARVAANTTRDGCGQSAWSKLPRGILRVWSLANSRLERPNNDGLWTQTTGWKALTTNACRQSACGQAAGSKLPRDILRVWGRANGRLERLITTEGHGGKWQASRL